MKKTWSGYFLLFIFLLNLSSCSIYKQNFMFKTDHSITVDSIEAKRYLANQNYIIQKNNYLSIKVYTNKGERLIDPNFELSKGNTGMQGVNREELRYLVRENGMVNIPMIGDVKLEGYKLYEADSILNIAYSKYYYDPYVVTRILNNRVVVMGGSGTATVSGKVLLLENESMSIIEVLALYGGLGADSKAHNIKVIRGNLKNPDVQVINLHTIEGMKQASLDVKPNDIIYIEPVIRVLPKTIQDIYPVVSIVSTLLTVVVLLFTLRNR